MSEASEASQPIGPDLILAAFTGVAYRRLTNHQATIASKPKAKITIAMLRPTFDSLGLPEGALGLVSSGMVDAGGTGVGNRPVMERGDLMPDPPAPTAAGSRMASTS